VARLNENIPAPSVLIFDWHGTLVDTHDAMFSAMEDMLPKLEELGLVERLLPESKCRTSDDARLVRYIRIFRRLHPRILAERRVSRTDIFNAVFGDDKEAKLTAHKAYNEAYRRYFGQVRPFQPGAYEYLSALRGMGIRLAVSTNRNREFLDKELATVDEGRWRSLFDATVCADDVTEYKPAPEVILKVLETLGLPADTHAWYIGDSYMDMLTATRAGVSGVFYNGACWEPERIDSWFSHRDRPAAVLDSFEELFDLLALLERSSPGMFQQPVAETSRGCCAQAEQADQTAPQNYQAPQLAGHGGKTSCLSAQAPNRHRCKTHPTRQPGWPSTYPYSCRRYTRHGCLPVSQAFPALSI
jgi:phosphoglycolate phosphatase